MVSYGALPSDEDGTDGNWTDEFYDPDQYTDMPMGLLQRLARTGDSGAQEEIDYRLGITSPKPS